MAFEPLKYSQEAQQRIIIGLRWDPQKLPFYFRWFMPRDKKSYDLDLTCYVFNIHGDFVGIVSGEEMLNEDCGGAIYHSGDEKSGNSTMDDEQISIELASLEEDIGHIVFVATCKSAHNFDKVKNPAMRIADGKTNQDQLRVALDMDGAEKDAFIFARIFRDGSSWMFEPVKEFTALKGIDNWPAYLQEKWALG